LPQSCQIVFQVLHILRQFQPEIEAPVTPDFLKQVEEVLLHERRFLDHGNEVKYYFILSFCN
jgi:hypothetical protein